MTEKITADIAARLEAELSKGVSADAMKAVKKSLDDAVYRIEDDITYRLKDELAPQLTAFVVEMCEKTIKALLKGNESEMIRYLQCDSRGWTGRSTSPYAMNPDGFHSIIHGALFEQGAIKLRRDIVNAHRDLLTNERILDLEDQVKSLVLQVNKANREREAMWERCRVYMQ